MDKVLSALKAIDVASLSYKEWIDVGMALKHEGYPCSIWDDWSRNDRRYKPGACEKKWDSFRGNSNPKTIATVIQMAQERGWTEFEGDGTLDWGDAIEYDGNDGFTGFNQKAWDPVKDLITYLETLFKPDEKVAYVTNDVWKNEDGRWMPSKGIFSRSAGELIDSLKKHPDDIGATIGDYKEEAGAWIRFNPLDGKGVKNDNVTSYRFALVESDTLPIPDQNALFRKMELPIAVMVHSGGKSLHAIVRIDASDYDEYRKRVEFLYAFLEKNGIIIDKQNRNPSRLSRMPGVTRNGNRQYIVDTNIGRKSWADWVDFAEGASDELPEIIDLSELFADPPPLSETLIEGVLRRGHKMLISGSSKAGKSFLLMQLCVAIAEGQKWLKFQCKQGRVLYINLEIDPASCVNRFNEIRNALLNRNGYQCCNTKDLLVWNLRGHAVPLDQLVPKLVRRARDLKLDAVVIDPIYKVITGDENNASDMGAFCNQFDRIATELGCSVIYCHHHSKGAQGAKRAMDRASGSGVFARDPDAQLDLIEIELSDAQMNAYASSGVTAFRVESSLREFPNFKPVDIWFEYPLHRVDMDGILRDSPTQGSAGAGRNKNRHSQSRDDAKLAFDNAYDALNMENDGVPVDALASYLEINKKTIYRKVSQYDDYVKEHGRVYRVTVTDDLGGENE